jgi:lipopolysaccharide transport system permease protein
MAMNDSDHMSGYISRPDLLVNIYRPPRKYLPNLGLKLLWEYRELLFFLAWRDVKVLYKQTALGIGWAILQPIISMVIFSLIFGRFAKLPSEGIPYPVFTFVALLPWQLFANSLMQVSTSLVNNRNLLTKVFFPRLVIPLSAVASGLIDFAISLIILFGLLLYYKINLTINIIFLPFLIVFAILSALAVGLWLSALNVEYRDVQYAVPFIVQAWMFASPVAYSTELIPQGIWRIIYGLNPMAGVIQGFRWALLGSNPPDTLFYISIGVVLILLIGGLYYFSRMEETFADVI